MSGTTAALVGVVVVALVIGGVMYMNAQAVRRRRLDPGQQIGMGLGMLIGGIIGAATGGDDGGGG